MTKILILTASLIAATCGPALAYSNVSPKEAPHVSTAERQTPDFFGPLERTNTSASDSWTYRGGPKTND